MIQRIQCKIKITGTKLKWQVSAFIQRLPSNAYYKFIVFFLVASNTTGGFLVVYVPDLRPLNEFQQPHWYPCNVLYSSSGGSSLMFVVIGGRLALQRSCLNPPALISTQGCMNIRDGLWRLEGLYHCFMAPLVLRQILSDTCFTPLTCCVSILILFGHTIVGDSS